MNICEKMPRFIILIVFFWTSSARPSTFVHAPPGGKSSISFGGYPEEAPVRQPRQQEQNNDYSAPPAKQTQARVNNYENEPPQRQNRIPYANSTDLKSAPEPVRGRRQAPGGTSSIVIG